MNHDNSISYRQRQAKFIAQGALTNSKRPQCFVEGIYPQHIAKAQGAYVWDDKGRRYLDFICGLGTNLFGYAKKEINDAVIAALSKGNLYSFASTIEVEFAEAINNYFPFIEQIKVLKSGSDGCSAAVRIARAFQGVNDESEGMFPVRLSEAAHRVSQRQNEAGRPATELQNLRQRVPCAAEGNGNKAGGPSEVFKNSQRCSGGNAPLPPTMGSGEEVGAGQGLLCGPTSGGAATMRGVREAGCAGSPQGLFATARRELALPDTSRSGTPRTLILSDGYHGHHDLFTGLSKPRHGVPFDPNALPLNGNADLLPTAAAVIIEPVITDYSPARIAELANLRAECTKHGTLLIFDETITALRFPGMSFAQWSGITPDLIVFGKGLANGLPISIVGGPRKLMSGSEYFISTTYAGDTLAMAAALKVLPMAKEHVPQMWETAALFQQDVNNIAPELIRLDGYPMRGVLWGKDDLTKALFMQEMAKAHVLFGSSWFWCEPHSYERELVLSLAKIALSKIKLGTARLEGSMPVKPFAQKQRE